MSLEDMMARGPIPAHVVANRVCRDLPEGFELRVCMERGAAWVMLTNEYGDGIVLPDSADKSIDEQIEDAMQAARAAAMAPTGEKPSTGRLRTFQRASNGPRTEPRLPSAAYGCRREADGSVCCAAWCGDIERCVRVDVAQWPTDEWYERAWEIASEVAKHNAAPRRLVFAYLVSQEMANRLAAREADRAKEPT
jgi:hypothetical protein